MLACWVRVMPTHKYPTIWVNTNSIYLLNESRFSNPNTTYLLNKSVVLTCLSNFIKTKKKKNIYIYILSTKFI